MSTLKQLINRYRRSPYVDWPFVSYRDASGSPGVLAVAVATVEPPWRQIRSAPDPRWFEPSPEPSDGPHDVWWRFEMGT